MSLLPSRGPDTSTLQEGELQVVGVDEDVDDLLDALSSETARAVLTAIYEEPGTPSDVADRLDMSIQKVSYHIDKLADRELIAVAGTRYSEKGQEMTVYEPPEDPLVLFVGTQERKSSFLTLVKRLVPTVLVLGFASLLVDLVASGGPLFAMGSGGDGEPGPSTSDAPNDTITRATETYTVSLNSGSQTAADAAQPLLSPGEAFFLGGTVVLALGVVWWALRRYA